MRREAIDLMSDGGFERQNHEGKELWFRGEICLGVVIQLWMKVLWLVLQGGDEEYL